MSQELFYTSAPQGLKPGSQGFCTVAATRGMTPALVQLLEALSGYRPVQSDRCPVVWSHLRYEDAGRRSMILTRTCAAGLDYSRRGNTFSHHVVLSEAELPPGGPAWLVQQPGFLEKAWDGRVRYLEGGRLPPQGDDTPRPCRVWHQLTGDAGWGGIVAEACVQRQRPMIYLVFEPGMDLLPLVAESLALLPVARRWGVTFSTYFTGTPYGLECQIRGVLNGSPEHAKARRETNALLLDLTVPLSRADKGEWAEAGRTGQPPVLAVAPRKERAAPIPPAPVLTEVEPAQMRVLEAVEARLSAPTPARPLPAPPLLNLDPLPPPVPPPLAPKLPPPAPPGRSSFGFLLFLVGTMAGIALGALGMFLGLRLNQPPEKTTTPSAAARPAEAAPGFWQQTHDQAWRVARLQLAQEQARLEQDRDQLKKEEERLREREQALARERGAGNNHRPGGNPPPPNGGPGDGRAPVRVPLHTLHRDAKTVYFDLQSLEADKEYQFLLPDNMPLFRIGAHGMQSPGGQHTTVSGLNLGPRGQMALWWTRIPDNKVSLHLLGLHPNMTDAERRDFLAAVRASFLVTEGRGGEAWLMAFRPFQKLPRLRLAGDATARTAVDLKQLYPWEEGRAVLRGLKLRDRSSFAVQPVLESQSQRAWTFAVPNPFREGKLATVQVSLAFPGPNEPPRLEAELTLTPLPPGAPTTLWDLALREYELQLREELVIEVQELLVGVEVGGLFCELARIDAAAPDDFQPPPKKPRRKPVKEEEEEPRPPTPKRDGPQATPTKPDVTPGQAAPAPGVSGGLPNKGATQRKP